ncbi:endo alpha-1,4 polygalactosaminidase [Georgenia sp. TF02-10]|uniref:endo alpha-1,4 polygalactosaminidase n=1 Tax=Georgenia sp. TF02-10 TaxID=2917725 RepID=UPI001FA73E78|nr:endo alpha-1,4 polygalactosaminidase [Georgenia sp. TF02-10]UNX55164.1 endo alpha-1,4 polygalactosaminidase [Georgenia sp. TF02-10]
MGVRPVRIRRSTPDDGGGCRLCGGQRRRRRACNELVPHGRALAAAAALFLVAAGCAGAPGARAPGTDEPDPGASQPAVTGGSDTAGLAGYELPPTSGTFDYQLGGAYDELASSNRPVAVDVVVRDSTAAPLAGAYSVCYVNGFQTQPGEAERWLGEHEDLLLHDASGTPVSDPAWPDEYVLDPSTEDQRAGILRILGPVVTGCADAGFDAVEIDNLDTWTRFDQIDEEGALALARAYVDLAHGAGLAVAQKNAAEVARLAADDLGFDFAVTEECAVWSECAAYTAVYGNHVLQVEYPDALAGAGMTFQGVCALDDRAPLTILRDRRLVAAGERGYVYEAC